MRVRFTLRALVIAIAALLALSACQTVQEVPEDPVGQSASGSGQRSIRVYESPT